MVAKNSKVCSRESMLLPECSYLCGKMAYEHCCFFEFECGSSSAITIPMLTLEISMDGTQHLILAQAVGSLAWIGKAAKTRSDHNILSTFAPKLLFTHIKFNLLFYFILFFLYFIAFYLFVYN
jgi:hypothetical protein